MIRLALIVFAAALFIPGSRKNVPESQLSVQYEVVMVILITGATHTGKTMLAQRMLEKYKYPLISIDLLKMGLIRSGLTRLTPEDDDELTVYLWPMIREIIKTAVENGQDLIIEGCYFPFDWRKDLDASYLEHLRFICLAMTDRYIDRNTDVIMAHASDIEKRPDNDAEFCSPSNLKAMNREYLEGFARSGEQVTVIDDDYTAVIDSLLS